VESGSTGNFDSPPSTHKDDLEENKEGHKDNKVDEEGDSDLNSKALTKLNLSRLEDSNVLFKDFNEPDIMKTGYLIPLTCGHNGLFSHTEKTIYEIHMANAGFIREADNYEGDEPNEEIQEEAPQ